MRAECPPKVKHTTLNSVLLCQPTPARQHHDFGLFLCMDIYACVPKCTCIHRCTSVYMCACGGEKSALRSFPQLLPSWFWRWRAWILLIHLVNSRDHLSPPPWHSPGCYVGALLRPQHSWTLNETRTAGLHPSPAPGEQCACPVSTRAVVKDAGAKLLRLVTLRVTDSIAILRDELSWLSAKTAPVSGTLP